MISRRRSASTQELPMCASPGPPYSLDRRQFSVATSRPSHYEHQWTGAQSSPHRMGLIWTGKTESPRVSSQSAPSSLVNQASKWLWLSLAIGLITLPWIQHSFIERRWMVLEREIKDFKKWEQRTVADLHRTTESIQNIDGTIRTMRKANNHLLKDTRMNRRDLLVVEQQYSEMEEVENALIRTIDRLEGRIQDRSRISIENRFGRGPHFVEISVTPKLKSPDLSPKEMHTFTIELASPKLMPHSVHQFLRMVSEKLWDGLAFVYKASHPHVIQATPLDIATAMRVNERFEDLHLSKLAFSEYSHELPHIPYTVGFSRRGPDFYINTEDNSQAHGPTTGGDEDPEACFGKVVNGSQVVDRLVRQNGDASVVRVFKIESARILPPQEVV